MFFDYGHRGNLRLWSQYGFATDDVALAAFDIDELAAAVSATLAPKQVKYDYVSIREAFGVIGDGLPVIDVDLRPGREPERKKG